MEIGEPTVLAKLPRPQIENGQTCFGPVYSVTNGVKRKRQEICAAIDGDSVNVYEIQQGRNISSCPVPPDARFSCQPCSLRSRSPTGITTRKTYYVTNRRNESKLTCFEQEVEVSGQKTSKKSVVLGDITSQVVQLETLPGNQSYRVLAIKEDASFDLFSAGLSSRLGQGNLTGYSQGARLVMSRWLSLEAAGKTILKSRPDIVAVADLDCSFLIAVFAKSSEQANQQPQHGIEIGVWQLSESSVPSLDQSFLQPCLFHTYSISSPLLPKERQPVTFVLKDTKLVLKTHTKTYQVDLTGSATQRLEEITTLVTDQQSTIFVSKSLLLASTSNTVVVLNTNFRTIQAKVDLNRAGLKRKRRSTEGPVTFVAFFAASNRAIANRKDCLIAVDLQAASSETFTGAVKQSSRLLDNIGKGAMNSEVLRTNTRMAESLVGGSPNAGNSAELWQQTIKQLEKHLQEKEYGAFEDTALNQVSGAQNQVLGGSQVAFNHKIDYLISKIFEFDASSDLVTKDTIKTLKIVLPVEKTLLFLTSQGLLTAERIGKVFKSSSARPTFDSVKSGNLSVLLSENDDSLQLLCLYLQNTPFIPCEELCAAVQILLGRALSGSLESTTLAISNTAEPDLKGNRSIDLASKTAKVKQSISTNVQKGLCIIVERFEEVEQKTMAGHFKNALSHGQMIALIQFLRQQLFQSGYTRSLHLQEYPSPPTSESGLSPRDNSTQYGGRLDLSAIVATLSACIDAIGPIGVLDSGDEEQFVQTLIPELSSEIARAAEAIQDTIYLGGLLRETLRFVESTTYDRRQNSSIDKSSDNGESKPGVITILYSEAATEGDLGPRSGALPLSLRMDGRINSLKTRKGDGRQYKRSEREKGMLQDRLRGPYSFERLVL